MSLKEDYYKEVANYLLDGENVLIGCMDIDEVIGNLYDIHVILR